MYWRKKYAELYYVIYDVGHLTCTVYTKEAEPLDCTFRIEKRDQYQPTPEPYIQEVRVIAGRTNIELSAWVSFKEVMTIPSWLIQQTGRQFFFFFLTVVNCAPRGVCFLH